MAVSTIWLKPLEKTTFLESLEKLENVKLSQYDMVINDFEPISAWACYFKNMLFVYRLSHQAIYIR